MSTNNAFAEIVLKFGQVVGKQEFLAQSVEVVAGAILVIALLSCFFGIRFISLSSAVMTFFLTSIAIIVMLRPTANMGVIVTTFAVVGLIASFLVFNWYKFSLFLFVAMMGYSMSSLFTSNLWLCIWTGILLGVAFLTVPPMVVMLSTAVWGGVTLGFDGLSYIGVQDSLYKILAAVGLTAAGFFTQYSMNKTYYTSHRLELCQMYAKKLLRRGVGDQ